MAISESDIKILWGRAAGLCCRCKTDLTVMIDAGVAFNVGEMAHVIARSIGGPRAGNGVGPDTYANLILLCPTCHRMIDKAPEGQFPASMIHEWKRDHETQIRCRGIGRAIADPHALKAEISDKLAENRLLWSSLGPKSEVAQRDPTSNLAFIWQLRKLDTIIPNNNEIINLIESNRQLVSQPQYNAFLEFKIHARAFERHQYHPADAYPLFPAKFAEFF